MEGADKAEELSDRRMRLIVKKDSDTRLKSELIGSQSILTSEEVNDLSRASLVGYVTLLRQLNKSTNSCRNKIDDFDPQKSKIFGDDDNDTARSKSVSDDKSSREGPISISGLVQSQVMTQSIGSTTDTSSIAKSIDYLIALQREERIEKERQLKEEKAEKEKQLKEEKAEKERQLKEEKEERERLYDLRERKEKEHRAEKEKLLELKEKQLKEEKAEKERQLKEEKAEKERLLELKEKQLKEEKAEKERLFELKEKKEKEEREERWRIER